jgi:hypothetical protein
MHSTPATLATQTLMGTMETNSETPQTVRKAAPQSSRETATETSAEELTVITIEAAPQTLAPNMTTMTVTLW